MHHVRELRGHAERLSEKKIQNVDAVRGDVEEWTASGLGGIDQPTAAAGAIEPHVAGEFGENWFADCAGCEQLSGALHFGIRTTIVGQAEGLSALLGGLQHGAGLGFVHGHRLLAEYMLAGAQGSNGLRRMQEYGRSDVDSLHFSSDVGIGESLVERGPDTCVIWNCLGVIACNQAVEAASGLGLNCGDDTAGRDVADSDDDPVEHGSWLVS